MNEISTALKTLTDRITVKLEIGEKHFNVFLCIALCALVIYPLLFTAVVHFRTLPLGIQLLIVTGISVGLFSSPRSAFRILGFQRMDLLCTGWYPFLYVRDLLGICLPSLRS